ncbi:MAG: hypothetical protein FJ405_17105, partial [Verrucomicrobia bacterium]|nr:hypothetical protein [Verrucomicrobiota bacterium]
VLRVSFPTSSALSITATSLSPITLAEGIGPIAFNASSSRLIGLNVESHRLLIFDVSSPSSALLLGQMSMPEPSSPNAAGIGQTAFGGGRFYALESQNGLIAVALASETSAPEFVEQPADLDVLEGAPVFFAASALGQQPIRFQWTVGESPIPGETNRVLRFDSASGTNAGVYQVVASNSLGTVTSREAQLTVLESVRSKVASRAWAVAPGAASHVPASPVAMAMTVNRQSGNLVLLHREGNNTVFVVDPANGDAVRVLSLASELLGPGAFRLGSIASADDGAIYASTISQDGVATPVRIYRWPNDDGNATPGVVFAGDPGLGAASSWGSGMAVRGSGPTLEILLTSEQGNSFSILTPNGATLSARRFQVDVPPGSLGSVPAFGQGASFWVKPQNSALLSIGFNLASGLASVLRTAGPDDYPAEAAPIAFLDGFSLLASVHPGVSTPVLFHRISNEDLALVDTEFFPGIAPPGSRLASIAAHGKTVFAWMPGAGLVGISVAGSGDPPMLNVSVEGDGFRLTWAGDFVLQTALDPAGPWTDVSGASSGHRVVFESGQSRFFRLRE